MLREGKAFDHADLPRLLHVSAAAGTAVKPRNVDDADASREFFLASVVERLELRGGGEEFFDGYISCNRVVCRLFNRLQLFLSHRTVKVNCDDIVIHVETHVLISLILLRILAKIPDHIRPAIPFLPDRSEISQEPSSYLYTD